MPWANGGGTTAEVATGPDQADEWHWRISIADVERDGPFSSLPGIDRTILVARGEGMALTVDGVTHIVQVGGAPLPFAGEAVTTCRLLDGAINDLNLMLRRDHVGGGLRRVHLDADDEVRPDGDDVAVVVLRGSVTVGDLHLQQFDALVATPAGGSPTIAASEPTDLAIASVYSRDADRHL